MDGNNLWKVEKRNYHNCPDYRSEKIVEGKWIEVCQKYNPNYSDEIRISPLHNYREDFGKTLQYYPNVQKEYVSNKIDKSDIVNKTLDVIEDYNKDVIKMINNKIREAASNGENVIVLFEIDLEEPEKLKYFYTKLEFNFAYVNNNLRLEW